MPASAGVPEPRVATGLMTKMMVAMMVAMMVEMMAEMMEVMTGAGVAEAGEPEPETDRAARAEAK